MENPTDQKFKIGDVVCCKFYAITKPLTIVAFSRIKRKFGGDSYRTANQYCVKAEDNYMSIFFENELEEYKKEFPPIEKCPICGSNAIVGEFTYSSDGRKTKHTECAKVACSFKGPECETAQQAIGAWNTIVKKIKIADSLKQNLIDELETQEE